MSDSMRSIHRGLRTFTHLTNHWFQTPPKGLGERNSLGPLSIQPRQLEARAITLYASRISEHTRITHILFILAPVLFPLCHVIKSSGKLVTSNLLEGLFAAVTDDFNCFDSRVRRGFN